MNTDIDKMNVTELKDYLHKFADAVFTYDKLRDAELRFLDDHPNRDMWDNDEQEDYNTLFNNLADNWGKICVFFKEIDADKYFTL